MINTGKESKYNLDDPKIKNLISKIKKEITGEDDAKTYVLYSNDPTSKNFTLYKNPSNKLDFELPDTAEKFVLTDSALEIGGISLFITQRDRTDCLPFDVITEKITFDEAGKEVIPVASLRLMIREFEEKHPKAPNIPIEFLPLEDVRKAEEEMRRIYKIQERPRTPSGLYAVHRGAAARRAFPVAKLDFNMKITVFILCVLCIVSTVLFMFPFINTGG